jgi:hypothetical protein
VIHGTEEERQQESASPLVHKLIETPAIQKGYRVKKSKIVHLQEDQACYVLITCGKPGVDGKMSVEMTYEGDPLLASFLLENAQGLIDKDEGGLLT